MWAKKANSMVYQVCLTVMGKTVAHSRWNQHLQLRAPTLIVMLVLAHQDLQASGRKKTQENQSTIPSQEKRHLALLAPG